MELATGIQKLYKKSIIIPFSLSPSLSLSDQGGERTREREIKHVWITSEREIACVDQIRADQVRSGMRAREGLVGDVAAVESTLI